eukprot:CAMPEP_0184300350 /NCGR_PEP_ID=MMETSP1049-20130417/10778_1 /TAXON_ID=77928 /ORGANISM="Proteomonas sulcata, Strain CCMP704" /LENGTH=302 /DNA_ID=CAMNT_0026611043 /DNA_START=58 /DNA_END=966 /DNA_ORIENTATION=+
MVSSKLSSEFTPMVLSIQSHTVHGYVGNRSAVFPMQTLGIEVDFINSVQFSNHTGYPSWTGASLDGDQLWQLIEGLKANSLMTHTHLLTGYMRSPALMRCVLKALAELRTSNPDTIYVCDPVMGDHGKLYVPEEVVPVYRDEVVPNATILTPNQFEAELLTGIKIETEADAIKALDAFHDKGVPCVIFTSMSFGEEESISLMASRRKPDSEPERLRIDIPQIKASFTGTGDLTAALVLAWFQHTDSLATVLENVVSTVQSVLSKTMESGGTTPQAKELKLVQSRDSIVSPKVPVWLKAKKVG